MTGVQMAFNAALDANPIGLIIIAIAAVIAIFVVLYNKFKPFRDAVDLTIKANQIAFQYLANFIGDVLGSISGVWNSVWGGISSFFSGIWDGIVGTVEKAIDKIKGIINGVKDIIGGIGKGISKIIPHFATGGIVGQNDQIVMVNDGTGADWKELIHLPSGELMMSNERNALMPLPIGTRIYSGADTKEIMKKQGINNYETGGYVGQKPFNLSEKLSNTVNGIKNSMNSISGNPMIAGVGGVQMPGVPQGGGVDLSGDTQLIINLDSAEIASKTWPKIKMLQNLDVQTTGMARGLAMTDNIIVQRQDGTTYNLEQERIRVINFDAGSPNYQYTYNQLSKYYYKMSAMNVQQRVLSLTFDVTARDNADYELQRLKVMRIFDSSEPFYIINQRLPWLRWKVLAETFNFPRSDNYWKAKNVSVNLDAIDGYGETVATTADMFTFDDGNWGIGMGIPFDSQQYSFTNQSTFNIYNPSAIPLLANERPVVINFQGNASQLSIQNTTTGQEFTYNNALSSTDKLQLIGIVPVVNGQSMFGSGNSNRAFLDFAKGDNNIVVNGASNFTISFETRFYY